MQGVVNLEKGFGFYFEVVWDGGIILFDFSFRKYYLDCFVEKRVWEVRVGVARQVRGFGYSLGVGLSFFGSGGVVQVGEIIRWCVYFGGRVVGIC